MNRWDKILAAPQAEYPSELVIRFVARNYYKVRRRMYTEFLDLGSGGGANSKFLEDKGFNIVAVDSSPSAVADLYCDIEDLEFPNDRFDCILDYNTLCHVKEPPFEKIKNWLKPEGKFFSVCPSFWTWRGHLEGKGFCRLLSEDEARNFYSTFCDLKVGWWAYPDQGHEISGWAIEGCK